MFVQIVMPIVMELMCFSLLGVVLSMFAGESKEPHMNNKYAVMMMWFV